MNALATENQFSMSLSETATALQGELTGTDGRFCRVSTDSRSLQHGDLFVAIQGEHFDGHNFVATAEQNGAVAAMVHHKVASSLPLIKVTDTRRSLGTLAAVWRSHFAVPVIAVTGSNGKTTVKEMIAAILGEVGNPLVTQGNLNNDIGLPLTLLRLQNEHTHAVLEMGANHSGEIEYLVKLGQPDVALVNNAMPAHIEGFGSLEGVARAKGEIFSGLTEDGIAIINADDQFAGYWQGLCQHVQQLSFGLNRQADVTASSISITDTGSAFTLHTPVGEIAVSMALLGQHNILNALAAAACCLAVDVSLEVIQQGLARMKTVSGRLQVMHGKAGSKVIHDAYNANPASFRAAIDVLAEHHGKRLLVMGDMAELGDEVAAMHAQIGEYAKQAGVDQLLALGTESWAAVDAFGEGASHFASDVELCAALDAELDEHTCVLVKGSRAMRMERIVQAVAAAEVV
jgi:UDP-N-acetylmuramoyl-tripeptide--D-alanyl-D-alanine ligase